MLMLNTDLHVADLSKHMSRADFVRNAMRAIQESMPDGPSQSEILREDSADFDADSAFGTPTKSVRSPAPSTTGSGQQTHPPAHRSASAPLPSQPAALTRMTSEAAFGSDGKSRSISNSHGSMYSRAWEAEAENVLKVGPEPGLSAQSPALTTQHRKSTPPCGPSGFCCPLRRLRRAIANP